MKTQSRVAILHDWLDKKAGAENVLEQILKIYPDADIFTLVDFMDEKDRSFISGHEVFTSFIQKLPFAKKFFRFYFILFPIAVYFFNLKKYKIIISSSHSYVKNINKLKNQKHFCYCYTPIRYCYDMKNDYLDEYTSNFFSRALLSFALNIIKAWDLQKTKNIDFFISISRHIQSRILTSYKRESFILHPSIDFNKFSKFKTEKKDFYVAASRFVPYKKIDLIIEVFNKISNKRLVIIGDGEKFNEYKKKATSENIIFLGWVHEKKKIEIFSQAKALIFPAFEDFGIVPIEAQACGTPVIAFGKGGVLDTIISQGKKITGLFFYEQTINSLINAIAEFENKQSNFKPNNCKLNAKRFDHEIFNNKFKNFLTNR